MNSERTRIYSEIYLFHHESVSRLSHIKNNSNYDWTFWLSDDCDLLHSLWISWLWEEECREETSIFWKDYELFFACCSCSSDEEFILDWLVDVLFSDFFCHSDDTNFCFFRSSAFWLFRIFIFDFSFSELSWCHASQFSHLSCQSKHVSAL